MSLLGTVLGTVAGKLFEGDNSTAIGSALGDHIAKNRSNARDRGQYARRIQSTVADARAAGIHPLEAIRAGAANTAPSAPRLLSETSRTATFDALDDALTGTKAARNRREKAEADLAEIRADEARRGVGSPRDARLGKFATGKTPGAPDDALGDPKNELTTRPRDVTAALGTGKDYFSRPDTPDAASFEERYGEPGEWLGGAYTGLTDYAYNKLIERAAKRQGKTKNDIHQMLIAENEKDPNFIDMWVRSERMIRSQRIKDQTRYPRLHSPSIGGAVSTPEIPVSP